MHLDRTRRLLSTARPPTLSSNPGARASPIVAIRTACRAVTAYADTPTPRQQRSQRHLTHQIQRILRRSAVRTQSHSDTGGQQIGDRSLRRPLGWRGAVNSSHDSDEFLVGTAQLRSPSV